MSYFAHAYKKYMTYLYTFRIFVLINTIFKHTLDFKSDPYTYVIFENFYIKYTDLSSILYLDTFSVPIGLNPCFAYSYNK